MAESPPPEPTLQVSTAVNPTNHGGIVTVVTLLCLVNSVIFTAVRLQSRWPWQNLFGRDDLFAAAATVFTVVQSSIVLRSADQSFGQSERQLSLEQVSSSKKVSAGTGVSLQRVLWLTSIKTIFASDILFVVSLALGKLAIAFLFHRLAASTSKIRAAWIMIGTTAAMGMVEVFVIAFRKEVGKPWRFDEGTDQPVLHRWIAVGALNVFLDISLSAFPSYLVSGVQMDKWDKLTVSLAFAFRMPMVILTVLRVLAIAQVDPNDWSFGYVMPEVYTQLEMHFNLAAATIPCLRIGLRSWNSSFMDLALDEVDPDAYAQRALYSNLRPSGPQS